MAISLTAAEQATPFPSRSPGAPGGQKGPQRDFGGEDVIRVLCEQGVFFAESAPDRLCVQHLGKRQTLGFGLALSMELAEVIASGMLGCPAESEDLEDALGEYLNLTLGHAKMRLGQRSDSVSLGIPEFGALPDTGWALELGARCGKGSMILQPPE